MSKHIVLLGDSIFDNRPYTGGKPDVVTHLRDELGTDLFSRSWAVTSPKFSPTPDRKINLSRIRRARRWRKLDHWAVKKVAASD